VSGRWLSLGAALAAIALTGCESNIERSAQLERVRLRHNAERSARLEHERLQHNAALKASVRSISRTNPRERARRPR
jgi:heme exporter protein D